MKTKFGTQAKNGDYVLVLDHNYMKSTAKTYIARVYKGKAYTGVKFYGGSRHGKYIHKLSAEIVIPESSVDYKTKLAIDEDICLHNKGENV